ncbi:hypothetical protein JTB14_036143 [Gonioctena quinquepunctata]|nr:hypothetical protein JTB14_036143 [Gonioctena quinquepunctata]
MRRRLGSSEKINNRINVFEEPSTARATEGSSRSTEDKTHEKTTLGKWQTREQENLLPDFIYEAFNCLESFSQKKTTKTETTLRKRVAKEKKTGGVVT